MGLISNWIRREIEEHKEQRAAEEANPQTIIRFGGGPLSITRNKQWSQETIYMTVTELKTMDPRQIYREYDVIGEEEDGTLIVRKKRKSSRIFSEDEIDDMIG